MPALPIIKTSIVDALSHLQFQIDLDYTLEVQHLRDYTACCLHELTSPGDDRFDEVTLVGVDISTGTILWTQYAGDPDGFPFDPETDGTTIYSAETAYSSAAGFRPQTANRLLSMLPQAVCFFYRQCLTD